MSKIIDEIKKISKNNEYDLNKFDSVYDLIAEIEEEIGKIKKVNKEYEEKEKTINVELETTKKEKEELIKENNESKKQILDLKEKYIDRFNEPIPQGKNKSNNNENITISDLFKEE